jgi:hypothetical protein
MNRHSGVGLPAYTASASSLQRADKWVGQEADPTAELS